jgi:hypothetical protein
VNLPTIELAGNSSLNPAGWDRTLGARFFEDLKLEIRRHLPVPLRESLQTSADQRVDQLLHLIVTTFSSTSINHSHTRRSGLKRRDEMCNSNRRRKKPKKHSREELSQDIQPTKRQRSTKPKDSTKIHNTRNVPVTSSRTDESSRSTKIRTRGEQQKPEEKSSRI